MKLKYANKEILTETLSDADSEILEACQNLKTISEKYGKQLLILTQATSSSETKKDRGVTAFYCLVPRNGIKGKQKEDIVGTFIKNLNGFIFQFSGGTAQIEAINK